MSEEVNPADRRLKVDESNDVVSGAIVYPQIYGKATKEIAAMCSTIVSSKKDTSEDITVRVKRKVVVAKGQGKNAQPTNQTDAILTLTNRVVPPPVDILKARTLKDISPHHASCVQSKKYSTVGLGFVSDASEVEDSKNKKPGSVQATEDRVASLLTGEAFIESKVDTELDPLTLQGFMTELYRIMEDFIDGGTGYLEVIRGEDKKITGLNWLPYEDLVAVTIRDDQNKSRLVYRYAKGLGSASGASGFLGGGDLFGGNGIRWYSLFGIENRQWVWDTFYNSTISTTADDSKILSTGVTGLNITNVSEVIPFILPSNRSKYYGYPEWLSATSFVTILSMALQYKSDFYTNRGVLAYILSIAGQVGEPKWKQIENHIQGTVGGGNNFKNLAINVADPKAKVQVDKLASSDKVEEQFSRDAEVFAQNIVSSHRVPPVLANILIPGKLGATNEAVQALVSFQLLVIGPYQHMIQKTLARTLGGDEGLVELGPEDFRLRSITSQFDITGLDTIGRAREEAVGSGRDFSDGVKD